MLIIICIVAGQSPCVEEVLAYFDKYLSIIITVGKGIFDR